MPIEHPYLLASIGGALVGLSAGMLWRAFGRVAGISGICGELLDRGTQAGSWRGAFLVGLVGVGAVLSLAFPRMFSATVAPNRGWLIVAGLLVGFGTRLGNGCTSGHGVCGIARLSPRSIAATATFIAVGAATVAALHRLVAL